MIFFVLLLILPTISLGMLRLIYDHPTVNTVKYLFDILFLSVVIGLVLKDLLASDQVTVNTICASLCVYLLIGVLWAELYSLVEILSPGSFILPADAIAEKATLQFGGRYSSLAL